ncbi:MAG: F-box protein [Candidatus Amoebophilus sp.]
MKYTSPQFQLLAYIIFSSLFLSGCDGQQNAHLEIGERPLLIKIKEQDQSLIGQGISLFDIFPSEIWQEIFSYLDFKGVLTARAVNRDWNELITGYRKPNIVGVENKPSHGINTYGCAAKSNIDFTSGKLRTITPETMPSFAFYCLMGKVKNLPQEFCPYLQGTRVHTVDLSYNKIGAPGAEAFAKHLQGVNVHTVYLSGNDIGDEGAVEFAKHLQRTRVHTVDLSYNKISDQGALGFTKHLQGTRVHTVDLSWNKIGNDTEQLLLEQYPHIKWIF